MNIQPANSIVKPQTDQESNATPVKPAKTKRGRFCVGIGFFVIGIITLIVGVVFLVLDLLNVPDIDAGEYLVSADRWVLVDGTNCASTAENVTTTDAESESAENAAKATEDVTENGNNNATNCMPSVIWKFTEIGKGTLTTNGHINDYDFIWAIRDGKLAIETRWLYDLNNAYEYELNQKEGVLTLYDGDKQINFTGEFTNNQ